MPTLQARHGFDYTFAGMASATLNTAYMTGALLLGAFGRRLPAKRWFVLSVSCCAMLLALLPLAPGPYAMLAAFIPLGMASAVSWSSAVGFVNGLARIQRRALILTLGASGGSWGMLTIGLMTGYGTKLMPPDWFWSVGAAFTLVGLAVLLPLMKEEAASASARAAPATPPVPRWAGRQPRVASLAIALSGLLGATAVPFTTYLSAYLTNEIGRPEAVSSAVWQVLGITGALSGLCIGSFADRYDYRKIIAVIFLAFAVACAFLSFAPSSSYISLAGIGHGIALNPFWGLIAAYISFFFAPAETMRIDAMGLAAFGLASGLANWSIGTWADNGGSLGAVYAVLAAGTVAMAGLLTTAPNPDRTKTEASHERTV